MFSFGKSAFEGPRTYADGGTRCAVLILVWSSAERGELEVKTGSHQPTDVHVVDEIMLGER